MLKKNQRVIITIIDNIEEKNDIDITRFMGIGSGVWNKEPQEYIKELRTDDRT